MRGLVHRPWLLPGLLLLAVPPLFADDTAEARASATQVFDGWIAESVKAYKAAAGLEESITFEVKIGGESPHTGKGEVLLGAPGELRFRMSDMPSLTISGGHAYVTIPDGEKKAAKVAVVDNKVLDLFESDFGDYTPLAPAIAFRYGATREQVLTAVTWGMLEEPQIERVETLDEAKPATRRLHMTGNLMFSEERVRATVDFDAKSAWLLATQIFAKTEHGEIEFSHRYQGKVLDKAPEIKFDAVGYEFVKDVDELLDMSDDGDYAPSIAKGDAAPSFSLVDHEGRKWALEELAGKYVLLDWWGIW